jgi:hypothetical protein
MEDFYGLLDRILRGLKYLEERVGRTGGDNPPIKFLQDTHRVPLRNEITVGTGLVPPSEGPNSSDCGICLNNKQAAPAGYSSVTDFILNAPPALVDRWRSIAGKCIDPAELFSHFTIVVEDASPDSCFGLLCLIVRLNGVDAEQVPQDWASYIDEWERGNASVAEDILCSYGPLHNALVHSRFNPRDGEIKPLEIGVAWLDGLRLMIAAISSRRQPGSLPPWLNSPAHARARALLRFEEQIYKDALNQATCVQLLVPIANTENRYRLVDACFCAPALPSGSLKVFLRNDREHPYLKSGFSLMGTNYHGTNEAVISVDPSVGIELTELWRYLESEEDRLWGHERPNDKPRPNISLYPDQKRPDGKPSPNQPWYIDAQRTLVASPRDVLVANQRVPGSKLDWDAVKESVWQCYQPFRHLKVICGDATTAFDAEQLVSLHECYRTALTDDVGKPRLFIAGWRNPVDLDLPLRITPTLCKYLAACVTDWRPASAADPVKLSKLPHESSYDVLEWPNAISVINADGAFVLYDASSARLPLKELKAEFERAVQIRQRIEFGGKRLARLLDDIKAYSEGRRDDLVEGDLAEELMIENIQIALELHKSDSAAIEQQARQFREVIMARWGIETWMANIARDIELVKGALQARASFAMARHLEFFQRFVVPVALATIFYGICVVTLELWPWASRTSSRLLDGSLKVATGLVVLAILSIGNFVALELYARRKRRLRRQALLSRSER